MTISKKTQKAVVNALTLGSGDQAPTATKDDVKQVLEKALHILGPKGQRWTNNVNELVFTDKHCVSTAIGVASKVGLIHRTAAESKALTAVRKAIGLDRRKGLATWNDSRRSFTPVKKALEKAIRAQG